MNARGRKITPTPSARRDTELPSRRAVLSIGLRLSALAGVGLGALTSCADERPVAAGSRYEGTDAGDDVLPSQSSSLPSVGAGPLVTGSFASKNMGGAQTRWALTRPAGVTGTLPVVIVAHALNTNERTIFDEPLAIGRVLQDHVNAGNAPFAIAAVDGGRNYWHPRTDGTDAAAMVIDEFLPMLAADPELAISTERIGLFGWSMGGYGALRIGAILGAPRVAAIAVSSPALWADPRNFAPRAFDNITDYQQNSLFGAQDAFRRIPVMIAIGTSDQFYTYTRQWAAGLHPPAAFTAGPGGHTNTYWGGVLPDQIQFLGRELTD